MLSLNVKLDVDRFARGLALQQKQVRYATAVALTRTAKFSERKVQDEIARAFDRPTSYTKRSTRIRPATKQSLYAEVKIKDEVFKAAAPIKWLSPQIYGGTRDAKRLEVHLRNKGILPDDQFIVPAAGAKMDRYGNISRGQIVQILSQLHASLDPYQNQTARSKRRNRGRTQYFALTRQHGKLQPGVYERIGFGFGSAVRPVLAFVRQPRYRKRLRFFEVANGAAQYRFKIEIAIALRDAWRSAW